MTVVTGEELISALRARIGRGASPFVIVVSGHGGAGKSTVAARLALELGGRSLGTDEFYLPEPERGAGLFDVHDWGEILRLLTGIRTADRLRYDWTWYSGERGAVDEPMPAVLVVEGIRLIRPEVLAIVDATIWLDCPPQVAGERAKARNRHQGDSEAEIALWDTKWIPEGVAYEARFTPAAYADFVVRTG